MGYIHGTGNLGVQCGNYKKVAMVLKKEQQLQGEPQPEIQKRKTKKQEKTNNQVVSACLHTFHAHISIFAHV